jgi:hypothetical protein
MSEELNTRTIERSCDEEYGLDGDGLCDGEVACDSELSWRFSSIGVCEWVGADLGEGRSAQGSGSRRSRSPRAQKRAPRAMGGVGEGRKPA